MEKRILEYEKFIANESEKDLSEKERQKLSDLHDKTLRNFQHERLVHLIIMLFFVLVTVAMLILVGFSIVMIGAKLEMLPLYILAALLVILVVFYIKHYYFLENHIQKLYDFTKKLG